MKERTVAFIVARLNSSRLPEKQLLDIGGASLLAWTIQGLKESREIDEIVLATTSETINDPLAAEATRHNISVFRYPGDPSHVTTRLAEAAKAHRAEIALLISGDCPLVDGTLLDRMITTLRNCPEGDYVELAADASGMFPLAEGMGVYRAHAWLRADALSIAPELKEHQFPVIHRTHAARFTKVSCLAGPPYHTPRHRMSVDTWADLEFHRTIHNALENRQKHRYCLVNAIRLLQEQPDIMELNRHVHQRGLHEKDRFFLFFTAGGGDTGYGHVSRCRELAMQAVERLGTRVACVVDSEDAARFFGQRHIKALRMSPVGQEAAELCRQADWIVIDLPPQLAPAPGWRKKLQPRRALVLDSLDPWAGEADLVVVPGVVVDQEKRDCLEKKTPVLHGREWLILRREITAAARQQPAKNMDLLVYLHHEETAAQVAGLCRRTGWSLTMSQNFSGDFHWQLARSRVLVNGFGVTSYEAIALGCVPVTWPHSGRHHREAVMFYNAFTLPCLIAADTATIEKTVGHILARPPVLPHIDDGCGRILSQLTGEAA